jgi:hypothetical protein
MKNPIDNDSRILAAFAFTCYGFAMTVCGIAAYALLMLTSYFSIGQGVHFTILQY